MPLETANLSNRLQALADIPLFIAADAEYGITHQISNLYNLYSKGGLTSGPLHKEYFSVATSLPSNMAIGATQNRKFAEFAGRVTALEARALGINWLLGPVLDVNNNPKNPVINIRSYGSDQALVADLGAAYIKGVQGRGVMATAKHFPGHGDTDTDSHLDLPVINKTLTDLRKMELVPFLAAVKNKVAAVMTAHILLPEIDKEYPATMSRKILTGLLREEMGFDGLIISDAMDMEAINKHYGLEKAVVKSFNAGADIILVSPDPYLALQALKAAVKSGEISSERLNESVDRILEAKRKMGLLGKSHVSMEAVDEALAKPQYLKKAEDYTCDGVTLVKNAKKLLPLDTGKKKVLNIVFSRLSKPWARDKSPSYDPDSFSGTILSERLEQRMDMIETERIGKDFRDEDIDALVKKALEYDLILISAFYGVPWGGGKCLGDIERAILNRLKAVSPNILFVAFGNPYLIREVPFIETYIATFSVTGPVESCVAKTILERKKFKGKSPVTLP